MHNHVACVQCRKGKRKCILQDLAMGCTNCVKTRRTCSATRQPPRPAPILPRISSPPDYAQVNDSRSTDRSVDSGGCRLSLPDQSLRIELVELYCALIHDKQHALFHRPSLVALTRSDAVEPFLILAMMAMVARFSQNPYFSDIELCERGKEWANDSRKLFDDREVAVSLSAVQGCALLANLAFIQGDSARESLYAAQQIRMVQLLGYPQCLSSDPLQREIETRVWWTTWMMDTWTSSSMGLDKQLVYRSEYPRPMEEGIFELLGTQPLSELRPDYTYDTGLWNQMIPLTEILALVNNLNKTMATRPLSQEELFTQVRDLESRLEYWQFCLPQCLQLSQANLQTYTHRGFGRILVALHLGYHHHSLQLFFQFLSFRGEHSIYERLIDRYLQKCKEHAMKLSNLLWTANTTPGLECLWSINGHLLVIASAVHLHTLLFDERPEQIPKAKEMLEHNFELLLELQKFWPSLELSISRLWIFQRACQKSAHQSTFDMNQWMLHFLQRYALPTEDQMMAPSPILTPSVEDTAWQTTLPPNPTASNLLQVFLQ